jgi:hypothetical protein
MSGVRAMLNVWRLPMARQLRIKVTRTRTMTATLSFVRRRSSADVDRAILAGYLAQLDADETADIDAPDVRDRIVEHALRELDGEVHREDLHDALDDLYPVDDPS